MFNLVLLSSLFADSSPQRWKNIPSSIDSMRPAGVLFFGADFGLWSRACCLLTIGALMWFAFVNNKRMKCLVLGILCDSAPSPFWSPKQLTIQFCPLFPLSSLAFSYHLSSRLLIVCLLFVCWPFFVRTTDVLTMTKEPNSANVPHPSNEDISWIAA